MLQLASVNIWKTAEEPLPMEQDVNFTQDVNRVANGFIMHAFTFTTKGLNEGNKGDAQVLSL